MARPRLRVQSIGNQLFQIVVSERRQHYVLDPRSGTADHRERARQRVRGADLVVPVGPDQHQVPHLGMRDQVLEEVERRRIQPLQVV